MRIDNVTIWGSLIAGLLGLMAPARPAHADVMTGSFSGSVTSGADPSDFLGLGATMSSGDAITGSFTFNPTDIVDGNASNTLSITINDVTTGQTATYLDTGGAGSTFTVTAGTYVMQANGPDPNDIDALLTFNSADIVAGVYEQAFTSGADDASFGSVTSGDSAGFEFSITSADVSVVEPASLAVLAVGLGGLIAVRRRRQGCVQA